MIYTTKDAYLKLLQSENICNVVFTKVDGSERFMMCTLNEKYIPEEKRSSGTGKTKNDSVISVYDVQANDWRSFRIDSVKMFGWA